MVTPEQIRDARLRQADIKAQLAEASDKLENLKAETYIKSLTHKVGHYEAVNKVKANPDVQKAKKEVNRLEIEHYKAWIETSFLHQKFSTDNSYPMLFDERLLVSDTELP